MGALMHSFLSYTERVITERGGTRIVVPLALFISASAIAFFSGAAVSHADISSNLVGYWPFDEGSGTMAADASPSGNDGTLTGTADWEAGKFRNAFNFDGSSYFDVSRPVEEDFTICAWFKTTGVGGGGAHFEFMAIADSELEVINDGDFGFGIDSDGRLGYGGGGDGGAFDFVNVLSVDPVNDGAWHHGCVTRNATDGVARLYLDGVLEDSDTLTTDPMNGNPVLRLGGFQDSGGNAKNFVGMIDEMRVYDRALSPGDVAALYAFDPTASTESAPPVQSAGLPWCSGPMAPGWNMNVPGGGCAQTTAGQTTDPLLAVPQEYIALSEKETLIALLQQQLAALLKQLAALLQARGS
jgi:hypothetical protein